MSVTLARLLSPEDFGTIALLFLFTAIASLVTDGGLSAALIQRQDVSHTDESTVFWLNLGGGLAAAAILCAIAPTIAKFYRQPIIEPLGVAMAANILVAALGAIHSTLLTKRLDFVIQLKIGATATIISGLVAVTMAWQGFGVWALAVQTIVANAVSTILLWRLSRWRPMFVFSLASARSLFEFGRFILAANLSDVTFSNIYTLLVGKFFGVRDLGFYNRAESTKQLPVGMLTSILSRVAFPVFSVAAKDIQQLRRGARLAVRGVMVLYVPMILGLAAVAEPLIATVFGSKWLPSVPILQVLCLAATLWPLHVINLNLLIAQGYSNLHLRLEVIKKSIGIALLVAGTSYGVMGIAWSQVVFGIIAFVINAYYTRRYLDYGALAQLRDVLPTIGISAPMAIVVYWMSGYLAVTSPVALLAATSLGVAVFATLSWLFHLQAMHDSIELLRRRRP